MFSVNVPVPGEVRERAWELRSSLTGFEQLRDELTLVVKRLPVGEPESFPAVHQRALSVLRGTAPFEVRIDGIGTFDAPVAGPAPVVYLAVASPALVTLHDRLAAEFEPVDGIEGAEYVPHITLARGGDVDPATLEEVRSLGVEPTAWAVDGLVFWDPRRQLPVGEVRLPV